MRCTHCGAMIPDDILYCPECGMEVQIVPDYNPLDDVLAQEVKGSVEHATRQIRTDDIRRYRQEGTKTYSNSTRVLGQGELDEIRARHSRQPRRSNTGNVRPQNRNTTSSMRTPSGRTTGSIHQGTTDLRGEAEERRRQQIIRKKRLAKKRRQRALIIVLILAVVFGMFGFVFYQNSYTGQIQKGNQALLEKNYTLAEKYYKKAREKNTNKADAYTGLSNVFVQQEDLEAAEAVFLMAISTQPSNVELYKAAIAFYVDTKQLTKVSELIDGCEDDNVLLGVSDYVSAEPEFSLEEGEYPEVQEVALDAGSGNQIYYTIDGSEPDTSSTRYTEPILLEKDGETTIKAIAVNKKKIPSLTVSKIYTINIPVEDAPAVTPSTGQYDVATQITITVPEGYSAYYTIDGSDPTSASILYEGPIDMPEGQIMFKAVLMNKQEKYTQITQRNYILELAQ